MEATGIPGGLHFFSPLEPNPLLEARGVVKHYGQRSLRELLGRPGPVGSALGSPRVAALLDFNLTLERGESIGVIGANGAGKSTLLRLVAGISRPSVGELRVRGSVRCLLDLGAGFIDELTGRENAISILGLDGLPSQRGRELAESAIEFAGLGQFADAPVRTYSAGMRLRLAYALAVAEPADLLVIDEVLAVGDEAFQRRCAAHLREFLERGGSLFLASHNLYHVEKLCQRAIWLDRGRVRSAGPARRVTAAYRAAIAASAAPAVAPLGDRADPRAPVPTPGTVAPLTIRVRTAAASEGRRVVEGESVQIEIVGGDVVPGSMWLEVLSGEERVASTPVRGRHVRFDRWPLLPGHYRLRLVNGAAGEQVILSAIEIETLGTSRETGVVRLAHVWN